MCYLLFKNVYFSLCLAKGQNDTGAPKKKKKKCKKKNFKERSGDEKKPAPKSQQKPSGAPGKQKTPAAGKLTESKAKSVNGATAQTPTGTAKQQHASEFSDE